MMGIFDKISLALKRVAISEPAEKSAGVARNSTKSILKGGTVLLARTPG